MTQQEFIDGYCQRNGVPWERLSERRIALACVCAKPECAGWAMVPNDPESIKDHLFFYGIDEATPMTDQTKEPVAWTSESWLSQTRQGLEGYITGTKRAGFDIPLFTAAQGWQPIETAPKDGTWVLLAGGRTGYEDFYDEHYPAQECPGRPVAAFFLHADKWSGWVYDYWNGDWNSAYVDPTHWMPLPAAPDKGSRA